MLDNLIGKIMGGIAGRFLKGYAVKIGLASWALLLLVALVGKSFPDLGLPGSDMSYADILKALAEVWNAFSNPAFTAAAGGGATILFGLMRRAYHVGLVTPVPDGTGQAGAVQRLTAQAGIPQQAADGPVPTAEIQSGVIEQEITPGPSAGSGGFSPQGN